jgi:hypothetical protein
MWMWIVTSAAPRRRSCRGRACLIEAFGFALRQLLVSQQRPTTMQIKKEPVTSWPLPTSVKQTRLRLKVLYRFTDVALIANIGLLLTLLYVAFKGSHVICIIGDICGLTWTLLARFI